METLTTKETFQAYFIPALNRMISREELFFQQLTMLPESDMKDILISESVAVLAMLEKRMKLYCDYCDKL